MFLVQMDANFPLDLDPEVKADLISREKAYGQELQKSGRIVHLWRVVGPKMANICLYDIDSPSELQDVLSGLPMRPYLDVAITPVANHPSVIKMTEPADGRR
jgi:muconolactone D-isomerase